MATTQYIGARYVPLFYTNPDDSSNNWKSGVAYDPLTVVTDLNQSYTSKIPVPASIGRPSENLTYWILTGAYNAQVEQYRQDVETYRNEVSDYESEVANYTAKVNSTSPLFNKRTVVYGDSLTTVEGNYITQLINNYNLDIENRSVSGTTLADALSSLENANDLNSFDNIILAFGTNHWQSNMTIAESETAYRSAFNTILRKNPIITIICITPFWSYHKYGNNPDNVNTRGYKLSDYVESTKKVCAEFGVRVIDFYTTSGCNKNNYTTLLVPSFSDPSVYVHESPAFGAKLADLILNSNYSDVAFTPNRNNYINCLSFGAALMPLSAMSNLPAEARGGLCFAFQAATNYDSLSMYFKKKTYILSGYSTTSGTVTFLKGYDKTVFESYSIQAGFFSIPLEPDISTVFFIRFNMSGSCYIGDLELFSADNDYSTNNLYQRGYGFSRNASLVRSGQGPSVVANGYIVTNSDGYFVADREITAGDILYTSNELYFPTRIILPANIIFTDSVHNKSYQVLLSFYQNALTFAEGSMTGGMTCRIPGGSRLIPQL